MFEYGLECSANILAYCIICSEGIHAEKTDDIHILYRDFEPLVGEPICDGCFELLRDKVPERLDCLKKKYSALYRGQELRLKEEYIPKKVGLERWM